MLPQYTLALGGTKAVEKFVRWLESQKDVLKTIKDKYERKDAYAIGK